MRRSKPVGICLARTSSFCSGAEKIAARCPLPAACKSTGGSGFSGSARREVISGPFLIERIMALSLLIKRQRMKIQLPRFTTRLTRKWLIGLLFVPVIALALPADRQQPIKINSDTADIDNKKGVSVYRGDVVMTQGTTRITGDMITIYTRDRELTRVIAQGNKARAYYEEQQPGEQGIVQAWGNTIRYDVDGDQIELIKNAQLSQKGDTFRGEKIDYNLTLQTVNAKSTSNQGDSGRVQMVIQPRQEKK